MVPPTRGDRTGRGEGRTRATVTGAPRLGQTTCRAGRPSHPLPAPGPRTRRTRARTRASPGRAGRGRGSRRRRTAVTLGVFDVPLREECRGRDAVAGEGRRPVGLADRLAVGGERTGGAEGAVWSARTRGGQEGSRQAARGVAVAGNGHKPLMRLQSSTKACITRFMHQTSADRAGWRGAEAAASGESGPRPGQQHPKGPSAPGRRPRNPAHRQRGTTPGREPGRIEARRDGGPRRRDRAVLREPGAATGGPQALGRALPRRRRPGDTGIRGRRGAPTGAQGPPASTLAPRHRAPPEPTRACGQRDTDTQRLGHRPLRRRDAFPAAPRAPGTARRSADIAHLTRQPTDVTQRDGDG